MIKYTIPGELADLNTFIDDLKTSRFRGQKVKNQETDTVAYYAIKAGVKKVENYPVKIKYNWYSKDRRKDIDNIAFAKKFINDGLVAAHVLENDSQKYVAAFEDNFFIDKENPRVEIEIIEA